MKRTSLTGIILILATLSHGCGKSEATRNDGRGEKPPVAVEVRAAALSTLSEGVEVTGSLEPKFSVDVKTQIPGLIRQVFVTEWLRVKKGQPLARIDIAETEAMVRRAEAGVESAKAGEAQAQVAVNRADRELARVIKLKESGLATQQLLDDTRSESEAARARMEAARAQTAVAREEVRQVASRLSKGLVVAPIDGVVAARDVNVGDLASDAAAAKPIFRIVDNRLLNLTVTVPATESGRIRTGQPLEFTVDSLPGQRFKGTVMFINPELSPADRSLKVIAEVRNVPELLKGGLFAKGRIVTGSRNNVLMVPRSAVSGLDPTAKKGAMFVVNNGAARKIEVQIGSAGEDLVEAVSGLKAGEQYVVRGGFNLRDGDRVATGKR